MSTLTPHQEAMKSWETNAEFWDEGIGKGGNKYWKLLQLPTLKRMIDVRPGSKALDLATGNGIAARWLASEGASVLATDGSPDMLEKAKLHHPAAAYGENISYRQLDVTEPAHFEALMRDAAASGGFDIILINMAIMDISTIEPLAKAIPGLLKKDGVFVATLLHPVFTTSGATRSIEVIDSPSGRREIIRGKTIRNYLDIPPTRGVALYGQPARQFYFHRPMFELFSVFFKAGLVMDAMEEPAFTEADAVPESLEAQANFPQLPFLLAFRLRRSS